MTSKVFRSKLEKAFADPVKALAKELVESGMTEDQFRKLYYGPEVRGFPGPDMVRLYNCFRDAARERRR